MALLEKVVDAQLEICLHFQAWIPPLIWNGKKYGWGDVNGVLPPINFLIPDGEGGHIKAKFHTAEMRWEVIDPVQSDV